MVREAKESHFERSKRSMQRVIARRAVELLCAVLFIAGLPKSAFADESTKPMIRASQVKPTTPSIRAQKKVLPARVNARDAVNLQIEGAMFLDVREPEEFNTWHVPGSTLIPVGELKQRMAEISADKGRVITIICHSGVRSATAQTLLQEAGFSRATSIEGGIVAWEKEGLPIMKNKNFNP
jgi:rhodanese-related sulfurtransferase